MLMNGYKQLIMSDNNFKDYLNSFILSTGLSQSQFAKSVGMTPQQLNKYATGLFEPSQRTIQKIRSVYKGFMPVAIKADVSSHKSESDEVVLALTKFIKKVYEVGDSKEIEGVKDMVKAQRDNFMQVIARVHKQHDDLQKDVVDLSKDQKELSRKVEQLLTVHNQKIT